VLSILHIWAEFQLWWKSWQKGDGQENYEDGEEFGEKGFAKPHS